MKNCKLVSARIVNVNFRSEKYECEIQKQKITNVKFKSKKESIL
jgi:hypothetical protein